MKTIKLTVEQAKAMYGKDEAMDTLLRSNFSNEELGIKRVLPKRWKDVKYISGFHITEGEIYYDEFVPTFTGQANGFLPTEELAKAMIALCKLIYLRDIYNDGWVPDWENTSMCKYYIYTRDGNIYYADLSYYPNRYILAFKDRDTAESFANNFHDLLKEARPFLQ